MGVYIVMVVNNIHNVRPAVICMSFKSTLPNEFDVWFLYGRLEWDLGLKNWNWVQWSEVFCCTMKTCNGAWDWKLKLSPAKWGFLGPMETCNGNYQWNSKTEHCNLSFSKVSWKFFKKLFQNLNQLLKSWTSIFHDNIMGHRLFMKSLMFWHTNGTAMASITLCHKFSKSHGGSIDIKTFMLSKVILP